MTLGSYKAEIRQDGNFQCFACRKWWEYKTQCGLDFEAIVGRDRFLICNQDLKQATLNNYKQQGWIK
jgi:hypothetical protein